LRIDCRLNGYRWLSDSIREILAASRARELPVPTEAESRAGAGISTRTYCAGGRLSTPGELRALVELGAWRGRLIVSCQTPRPPCTIPHHDRNAHTAPRPSRDLGSVAGRARRTHTPCPAARNYDRERSTHARLQATKQIQLYDMLRLHLPQHERALIGYPAIPTHLHALGFRRLSGGPLRSVFSAAGPSSSLPRYPR
jgi:hypothetical protein